MKAYYNSSLEKLIISGINPENINYPEIISAAKERGFEITEDIINWLVKAWRIDYKSNYHSNGVNFFAPCRCNDFSITIFRGDGHTYVA